jgi:hypothetical protein
MLLGLRLVSFMAPRVFFSVEHGPDLVIEGLIVQVIDFDSLEVFFWIEITFSDKEGLPQDELLDFAVIVVHDIVVGISFFRALEEFGNLFG